MLEITWNDVMFGATIIGIVLLVGFLGYILFNILITGLNVIGGLIGITGWEAFCLLLTLTLLLKV